MSDIQLERIEARLRTLTILQQRTRLQVDRLADYLARLIATMARSPSTPDADTHAPSPPHPDPSSRDL